MHKQAQVGYSGFQVMGMIQGLIFWGGLKFSIPGFFGIGKFGKYFFGWLDLSRNFWGIKNNVKIRGSTCPCYEVLQIKYKRIMCFSNCFFVISFPLSENLRVRNSAFCQVALAVGWYP